MLGRIAVVIAIGVAVTAYFLSSRQPTPPKQEAKPAVETPTQPTGKLETATFGAGCFWCVEAVFQSLQGVQSVVSGYTGGSTPNPTYRQVCDGATGHAEVVQISFDPAVITFAELLEVFWQTHDPTTKDRQGNDHGTQYRSAVFFHNEEQQRLAEDYRKKLDESGAFRSPLVTEIVPAAKFYPAEDYHQNYWNDNPQQPYCRAVIPPKLDKLKKVFGKKLKNPSP